MIGIFALSGRMDWDPIESFMNQSCRGIFAAFITVEYFAISAVTNFEKSSGVPVPVSAPLTISAFLTFSVWRASAIALFNLSIIGLGVPFGANIPYQL